MMKKLLLIAGFSIGLVTVNAQLMRGNFIIDPYIGVPNWANSLLYGQYDGSNTQVSNYKTIGSALSYGGRLEYMIADKVGVGADIIMKFQAFLLIILIINMMVLEIMCMT